MTEFWIETAKQSPVLALVAVSLLIMSKRLIAYIESRDQADRDKDAATRAVIAGIGNDCHQFQRDMTSQNQKFTESIVARNEASNREVSEVVKENTRMLGQVVEAFHRKNAE